MSRKIQNGGPIARAKAIVISIAIAFLIGCAGARKPYRFTAGDVAKVHLDPSHCQVKPNGHLNCDRVDVDLATVNVQDLAGNSK